MMDSHGLKILIVDCVLRRCCVCALPDEAGKLRVLRRLGVFGQIIYGPLSFVIGNVWICLQCARHLPFAVNPRWRVAALTEGAHRIHEHDRQGAKMPRQSQACDCP